ncbi:hypothetical protein SAMN05216238_1069 [Lentibacillus persicus]|uniref:Uncharacterized protein n=1 Tax=Lentibacillus persicus TaxID=640948 RepID=A0A1I1WDR5_9BACI|nr:hypothetical protein SAMN05216238_1069 [Lentibacillus persicus]
MYLLDESFYFLLQFICIFITLFKKAIKMTGMSPVQYRAHTSHSAEV